MTGRVHSAAVLGNFRSIGINSSLNVWQMPVKPSGPALLCVRSCLITVSILVLVTGLFIFSTSSGSALEGCTFLRSCPFLLGSPSCWRIVACNSLLWSFSYFCWVCCNLFFISNVIDFSLLLFVSRWFWLMTYIFCSSSQITSFFKLFFIIVALQCCVSTAQQSESAICIRISPHF